MKTLNETEVKHSPTPWRAEISDRGMGKIFASDETIQGAEPYQIGWIIIEERNQKARQVDIANAEHIVKCVNNFDALVEQRNELLEACKSVLAWIRDHQDEDFRHDHAASEEALADAIAKAEGAQ